MKISLVEHQVYMNGKQGPFKCKNCSYYSNHSCNQDNIVALAKEGKFGLRLNGDVATVDPEGCSDYFKKR